MRVAVLQYAPKIGHVQENIAKVTSLCDKLQPRSIDLLCLPEMVFTGYVFPNAAAIAPFLEDPHSGPTSHFCAALAARLQCYVAAGFPERLEAHEVTEDNDASGERVTKIGANSAVLYDPSGTRVDGYTYRKTNLFETDKTWAKAGTGFATFTLPPPLGTLALGICMDLNPHTDEWSLYDGPFEIADHCIARKANVLVLLNAWLDPGMEAEADEDCDRDTINYWATRLRPLWAIKDGLSTSSGADNDSAPEGSRTSGEETIVVVCNRCGEENGKKFVGSSAVFSMKRGSGEPRLLHAMGRRAEGIEIWTIPPL